VERNCSHLNQGLMELGALVCTPRRPKCPPCPLRKYCVAFRERRTDQLPQLGPRIGSTARRFAAFVVERKRRFLVRRRPPGGVNGELWEFPNLEVAGRVADGQQLAADLFGSRPLATQAFHRIRHTITRYRITMEVFRVQFANGWPKSIENARWCSPAEFENLAFPSAHRKISQLLRAK